MKKGLLITFEGNECSGKTTVIPFVKQQLEEKRLTVKVFREPGNTPAGEDIRKILLDNEYPESINGITEALLYAAARSELIEKELIPCLQTTDVIITDRFYYSSLVWQGMLRGFVDYTKAINTPFIEMAKPDLALFLSVSPNVRNERMAKRGSAMNRLDKTPEELLRMVDDGYMSLVNECNEMQLVDADADLDTVVAECMHYINQLLCLRRS